MAPELLVFVPEVHPRLTYIFRWMGGVLGFGTIHLTDSEEEAVSWSGFCVRYACAPSGPGYWLPLGRGEWYRQNVLAEPEVQDGAEFPVLYPLDADDRPGMDLPAALFWLLSRVEEYDCREHDAHGRFPAAASLAGRLGFLQKPVADLWLSRLRADLQAHWPGLSLPEPASRVIPTIDVDFAWRYRHKPWHRQWRTLLGDGWRNGPQAMLKGVAVMAGLRPDPYALYTLLAERESFLFFPVGDAGPFDLQHSWREPHYRRLLRTWAERGLAGLHPSYAAATDPERLWLETERFTEITGQPPRHSRQHFLRMRLPETYRMLLEAGIREDWTMGYADQPGFRAGTAHPFPWYDLRRDMETPLIIHPLAVMDVTLQKYLALSPAEARERIEALWVQVRQGGGDLVTLWHQPSIACFDKAWQGWEGMFRLPQ